MVDFQENAVYAVHKTDVLKNYLEYAEKHGDTIETVTLVANELDRGWTIECESASGETVVDMISPTIFDQLIVDGVLEQAD